MTVLRIDTLTPQAEGLGRLAGRVVFVPGALAGETVEVALMEEKKRYSRARLVRVLESSPDRVAPPCPYFGLCGGCQLQHLPPEAQDHFKTDSFRKALAHALKLPDPPLAPLLAAPHRWRYRQRLRLQLGSSGRRMIIGFNQGRSHRVIPIARCLLADQKINDILAFLGPELARLPPLPSTADLEVRWLGENRGSVVVISGLVSVARDQKTKLARALVERKQISAVFFQNQADGPLTGPEVFSPERHSLIYQVPVGGGHEGREIALTVFPQVFSQVNLPQNRRLIALLEELPLISAQDRIWDLYCGQGNFSIPLSFRAAEVLGIETFAPAVENATWNQKINPGSRCRFIRATALEGASRLIHTGENPDWVILDPPRSGAAAVIPALAKLRARGLFYVSCEPMTLFRDLALLLKQGWRLEWTRPLDFFPQTYHLESLSLLSR